MFSSLRFKGTFEFIAITCNSSWREKALWPHIALNSGSSGLCFSLEQDNAFCSWGRHCTLASTRFAQQKLEICTNLIGLLARKQTSSIWTCMQSLVAKSCLHRL